MLPAGGLSTEEEGVKLDCARVGQREGGRCELAAVLPRTSRLSGPDRAGGQHRRRAHRLRRRATDAGGLRGATPNPTTITSALGLRPARMAGSMEPKPKEPLSNNLYLRPPLHPQGLPRSSVI